MRKTTKGNSLKKYIITEQMLNTLQSLSMSRALAEELDELKPIQPLTGCQINEIWTNALLRADPTVGNAHFKLARAIEARITEAKQ